MKYRKKPVVIEAVQWNGTNREEVHDFTRKLLEVDATRSLFIETPEGTMEVKPKDFIIKGIKGEFYPCKPDIFEATYEAVE